MQNYLIWMKFGTRKFVGHWLRIRAHNSEIQNGGSNMAAKKYKRRLDSEKNRFLVFFFKIPDSKYELKSEIKNKIKKN